MYENVSLGNDEAAICKTQYTEHSTQNTASYSPFRLKDFAFWGFYGLKINYFRQNDIFFYKSVWINEKKNKFAQ